MSNGIETNLYDLNKQLVSQLPPFEEARERIEAFKSDKVNYYMLLCRELNYYTLFALTKDETIKDKFTDVVIECANDIGVIKAANVTEDGMAFEIWVTDETNESFVMYLFNYDKGVVPCQL